MRHRCEACSVSLPTETVLRDYNKCQTHINKLAMIAKREKLEKAKLERMPVDHCQLCEFKKRNRPSTLFEVLYAGFRAEDGLSTHEKSETGDTANVARREAMDIGHLATPLEVAVLVRGATFIIFFVLRARKRRVSPIPLPLIFPAGHQAEID